MHLKVPCVGSPSKRLGSDNARSFERQSSRRPSEVRSGPNYGVHSYLFKLAKIGVQGGLALNILGELDKRARHSGWGTLTAGKLIE